MIHSKSWPIIQNATFAEKIQYEKKFYQVHMKRFERSLFPNNNQIGKKLRYSNVRNVSKIGYIIGIFSVFLTCYYIFVCVCVLK